jgi:uncharacterized membrane protein YfcA
LEYLTLLMAGAGSGLVAGVAGLGGGTVIVPVIVAIYGPAALHDAIVLSWFAVFCNSAAAVHQQWLVRTPQERVALVQTSRHFLVGVLAATPIVAWAVARSPHGISPVLVGFLQLTLAAAILWPRNEVHQPRMLSRPVDAGCGALVGAASTAIGIGGGAYTTVYMLHGPRKALRDALAAANVTGVAVGGLSILGFFASVVVAGPAQPGPLSAGGMAAMLGAGVVCSAMGVRVARRMRVDWLKRVVVLVLVVAAIRLLFS